MWKRWTRIFATVAVCSTLVGPFSQAKASEGQTGACGTIPIGKTDLGADVHGGSGPYWQEFHVYNFDNLHPDTRAGWPNTGGEGSGYHSNNCGA